MPLTPYLRVLAVPELRRALLLGIVLRVPQYGAMVLITVHVTTTLGRTYGEAGFLVAMVTLATAISGPWRGRVLDRKGLRRAATPSLIVTAVCWSIAPFVGYWWLMVLATTAGLIRLPVPGIIRQLVLTHAPEGSRRTAISLDSVLLEIAYAAGPILVVAGTQFTTTSWTLVAAEAAGVCAALVLLWINPDTGHRADSPTAAVPVREWLGREVAVALGVCFFAMVLLGGSMIGLVAATDAWGAEASLGLVIAAWSFGSMVGGLAYGVLPRALDPVYLLLGLGVGTLLLAAAQGVWTLAVLVAIAGIVCAPTVVATVDAIGNHVPAQARGEAMGWHAMAMTTGNLVGTPLIGVSVDAGGPSAGFLAIGALGAIGGLVLLVVRQKPTPVRLRRPAMPVSPRELPADPVAAQGEPVHPAREAPAPEEDEEGLR